MGANRARIGARRAPPEGRSRVARGSSRAVRGYCTLEEEGAAGRLWVFRAIPGFLLECRFSVDGLP